MFEEYQDVSFGALLKKFRNNRGISQRELAERVWRHRQSIAAWEGNLNLPEGGDDILRLGATLALSPQETNLLLYKAGLLVEPIEPLETTFGYLNLVRDGRDSQRYSLRGSRIVIGRHPECDIVLSDEYMRVSRRHAAVYEKDNAIFVEDLESRNGTFVDGNRVIQPTVLAEGQYLLLGWRSPREGVCVLEYVRDLQSTL